MATEPKYPFGEALGLSSELARAADAAMRAVDEMAALADPLPAAVDDSLTAWMMAVQDDFEASGPDDESPAPSLRRFSRVDAGVAAVHAMVDGARSH